MKKIIEVGILLYATFVVSIDWNDLATQTLILRWIHSLIILAACVELFRSTSLINNKGVTALAYKAAITLLIFFFARIAAAFIDSNFQGVGWASNLTNIVFWLFVFGKARSIRKQLSNNHLGDERRHQISNALDKVIYEMKTSRETLKQMVR